MGDIADAMLGGALCEACGVYLGDIVGHPRYCSKKCAHDRGAEYAPIEGHSGKQHRATPANFGPLQGKVDLFRVWLARDGATLLDPTNEWEVVRYRTESGVSVLYRNKHGRLRGVGEAGTALNAFLKEMT